MELPSIDLPKTAAAFLAIILVGVLTMLFTPAGEGMSDDTIFTMVVPSMIAFGLICLLIGVAHGQHRAGAV